MANATTTVLSPRQEIFSKEISKVQELMLENERSYEVQIKELTNKLSDLNAENEAVDKSIMEIESKDLSQYEKTVEKLEAENKQLALEQGALTVKNKEILLVIEEYQRSIFKFQSQYDTEEQQLSEQIKTLTQERDFALQLVETKEAEFNSIHQKYEKCKSIIEQFKESDKKVTEVLQESDEQLRMINLNYQNLKDHVTDKLEKSHSELSTIVRNNKMELAKLQAIQQQMELKCESQDKTILQSANELMETVKLCDELIGKYNK